MSDVLTPAAGDRFTFLRGEVRIDEVRDGQVYFVQWRGDEQIGDASRMTLETWREAAAKETPHFKDPAPVPAEVWAERDRLRGEAMVGVPAHLLAGPGEGK